MKVKDTDFAYCVARIRANEANLLSDKQLKELCHSDDYAKAIKKLADFGWDCSGYSLKTITDNQQKKLWSLLEESIPDKSMLDVFCILNDYFNIKTCVKCFFSKEDPYAFYVHPTTLDLKEITELISRQCFDVRYDQMLSTAEKAFNAANITEKGQSAEIIIDKAAIDCLCEYAKKNTSALSSEICAFMCDTANIKIALRINLLGKNRDFAETAIGNCAEINRAELIDNAFSSREDLIDYLCSTEYKDGVLIYEESASLFDKWCDSEVIKKLSKAKYTAFGFDPICAYYYTVQNEIKKVRVILTAKKAGLDNENIEKRVFTDV